MPEANGSEPTRWIWPRKFDPNLMMQYMKPSLESGHMTNNGPASKLLETEAVRRFRMQKLVAVSCASGSAALSALVATYKLLGVDLSNGILVSAFGFPPVLQGNWAPLVRVADVDPEHGGPLLPPKSTPPSAVCLVNPFGYRVHVEHYRAYCDEVGIPLWMDNAACPLHLLPDGSNLSDLADAATVSLHETKVIGRGEGGLLFVQPHHQSTAYRAINFGYDVSVPPEKRGRTWSGECSNWRMSDIAACAILTSWELNWDIIATWHAHHDHEVVDVKPFRRGEKGSLYSCVLEKRQPRPGFEVKYYYCPLVDRDEAPNAWAFYDEHQCVPFHPAGGPHAY